MIRAAGKSIAWDPRLDWTLVLKKNRPDGACPRHSSLASDGFRPGHATGGNFSPFELEANELHHGGTN